MPSPRAADRLLLLSAFLLAVLFAIRAVVLVASPYPSDYGEGTTWTYAHLLRTQGTYFLPIQQEPYIHGTYPPLFPSLHAALGGTLRAGRLLALAGTLLCAASIAVLVLRHRVSPSRRRRALFWAVVFLGAPAVHEWGALCRVDMLALGLSLAGIALADRRSELLAAPVLAAALFAKQVAVAAPAAVFLALWLARQRGRALRFLAIYGSVVLGGLALLDAATAGEARRHLFTYAAAPGLAPFELVSWASHFVFTFPVLLGLTLTGRRSLPGAILPLYVPLALLTLLLSGKPGAAPNYMLEASAACVLGGGLAAERLLRERESSPERRRDLVLLLAVQLLVLCGPGRLLEVRALWRESAVQTAAVAALAAASAPVLSDDLGLTLAAAKEPILEPFQFALLARAGLFDPAPVLADLERARFGAVLAGWRLESLPGFGGALARGYEPRERIGPYQVWRPKP